MYLMYVFSMFRFLYLRQPLVSEVHELQHSADELPVHGVVLVVAVERDAAADSGADDVHQPRQAA